MLRPNCFSVHTISAPRRQGVVLLIVIALLMISVNFALSAAATRLERRLRQSKRGTAPLEAEALEQSGAPSARIEPGD